MRRYNTLLLLRVAMMANTHINPKLQLTRCYPLAVCPGVAPQAGFFSYTLRGLALDALLVVVGPHRSCHACHVIIHIVD